MAGWKKAWLAVLERGGGGSGGALHVHLHGLHSPSSTSSFNFKRTAGVGGSKYHYGSYGNSKAVLVGVSFALVLAFFYVSVTSGPTADVSFPTPSAASLSPSSSALFSWLSSSTSASVMPRRSLPPHPPIPRNVTSTDQQSNASDTTARAQQEQNAEDSATKEDMGQPAPTTEQTGEQNSHQDARNTTVGSATEPVADSTKAQEQTQEAELPVPLSRIGPGANYSHDPVTGARSDLTDYDGTGNPTGRPTTAATLHGIESWNQEQRNENATFPMQNSTSQAAMPSSQSHTRIISYKYARRQKEIFRSAQDGAKEEQDNSATAGDQAAATGGDAGIIQPESPGAQSRRPLAQCDVFSGRWVRDDSYPFYPPGSCPHIDDDFNCHKNGRPDSDFLKWRWQPQDCDIPRLNATDFLERLRGKRMIFIGDSLNRNMWESLVCILRNSVTNRTSVYEASGRNQFKTRGYYSFKFREYNCCVDFVRSIFLVKEVIREKDGRVVDEKLRLDELDQSTSAYRTADIIVFNTGHWWTHSKTSKGLNYFQEGNHVYPTLDVTKAYKKGLTTWARWIDKNIDTRRTQVVFRGLALTHFKGGQWNSGGRCHNETEPIFNETYLTEYPSRMRIVEEVLTEMKTPVIYLNISRLTDYRKDAHPSVYRMWYGTAEQRAAAVSRQDCSHWCLPGVPDTWNELLYAALLKAGKGSWRL